MIHNLSMWSAREKSLTYEQLKDDADKARKDMKLVNLATKACSDEFQLSELNASVV